MCVYFDWLTARKHCASQSSALLWALCAIGAFLLSATPATAQACTGPDGAVGDFIYNSSHNIFQGCTARGWMAFHNPPPPDPCTTSSTIGTTCTDGQTVYAGSWNGNRYYTTKVDQASGYWGTYNVVVNTSSYTDGLTNTNSALASIEANPQTSGACNSTTMVNPPQCAPNAFVQCKNLRTTLGGNWYLPARDEVVNVLYPNRVAIGGFTTDGSYYWSSSDDNSHNATREVYGVDFSNGSTDDDVDKFSTNRVRCVRK